MVKDTELIYIRKEINGCISHDKEFKSYFKNFEEFTIEAYILVRTFQRNRPLYIYSYNVESGS